MPLPVVIAGIATWVGSVWGAIQPLVPGLVVISGWTFGSHILAFGGSWLAARWYSTNCIGTGMRGFYQSYWKMGSPTCMGLLTSHVALLAIAITSMLCTLFIFLWMWYSTFKKLMWPVKELVAKEFRGVLPTKEFAAHKKYGKIRLLKKPINKQKVRV